MRKQYLLLGENNFWYGSFEKLSAAKEEARKILNGTSDESYNDPFTPGIVYLYEAKEAKRAIIDEKMNIRYE